MDTRELAIQRAISNFNTGVYSSQRAAAKAYGIPLSTLHGRLRGATTSGLSY
ncbi:hypothetical protein K458DRAFT_295462 [Lentithecium fluviatile CBS 122367]|uniref:HTH psq-type domain-containing protein n=1 Tax=Lentithecium fluviatile CBS 122367 TaxID=1168545 RepID=A0A6G1JDP9_9PLEO|nr:hypothetical protein K458DRAFT_295462 [Lentithecium fluviatile CBS 122367]